MSSTNVLETRELGELDEPATSMLRLFEMPNAKLNLRGSSQYKHLNYRSDYDLIVALKRDLPRERVLPRPISDLAPDP